MFALPFHAFQSDCMLLYSVIMVLVIYLYFFFLVLNFWTSFGYRLQVFGSMYISSYKKLVDCRHNCYTDGSDQIKQGKQRKNGRKI